MSQIGKETLNIPADNDRHTHTLLPKGRTSTANGHTHTWNNRQNKTSTDDGHFHRMPLRSATEDEVVAEVLADLMDDIPEDEVDTFE